MLQNWLLAHFAELPLTIVTVFPCGISGAISINSVYGAAFAAVRAAISLSAMSTQKHAPDYFMNGTGVDIDNFAMMPGRTTRLLYSIKACPFCGLKECFPRAYNLIFDADPGPLRGHRKVHIRCTRCQTSGPRIDCLEVGYEIKVMAAEKWNGRASKA